MMQQLCLSVIISVACWHPTESLIDGILTEGATNDDELLVLSGNNGDVLTVSAIIGTAFLAWAISILGIYLLGLALEDDDYDSYGNRYGSDDIDELYAYQLSPSDPSTCIQKLICELAANQQYEDYHIVNSVLKNQYPTVGDKSQFSTAAKLGNSLKKPKLCSIRYSCTLSSSEIQHELLQYKY